MKVCILQQIEMKNEGYYGKWNKQSAERKVLLNLINAYKNTDIIKTE